MPWPMCMKMLKNSDKIREFSLKLPNGGTVRYRNIGIAMWGWVYKAVDAPYMARLLPIEDVREKEKRAKITDCINRPRQPQVVPIVDTQQIKLDGHFYFYIGYEFDPDGTWEELIENEDPILRLQYAAKVLQAIPFWWNLGHAGNIPMTRDIVLLDGTPFLLPLPLQDWPRLESLFIEPERIRFLAPELICSFASLVRDRNISLYAICVCILRCFYNFDDIADAGGLLARAASGNIFTKTNLKSRIPFWMEKVDQVHALRDRLLQAVHPDPRIRSVIDPGQMAAMLEANGRYLNPEMVIDTLRRSGRSQDAINLLQDILIEHYTYDFLLKGAQIAWTDLAKVIEAISFYDQAISVKPDNREAYKEQLELILNNTIDVVISFFSNDINAQDSVLEKLDQLVFRDFSHLPDEDQKVLLNEVGQYFLTRQHYDKISQLVYAHLFDAEGHFLWWEFSRTLLYAEALVGMGRNVEARPFVAAIKEKLIWVRKEQRMPETEIQQYGATLAQLELKLL